MRHRLRLFITSPALWCSVAWVISRIIMYRTLFESEYHIINDVNYYFVQTGGGQANALVEYPTPVTLFLSLLRQLTGGSLESFVNAFLSLMLVLDAAMAVYLWRSQARRAACYWAIFTFLIGPLCWTRLDLLSAIPVALAMLWLSRHPSRSGAMIALGAATKLWPALLIAPATGRDSNALRRTRAFLIVGGILGLASVVFFGWERSASPLTWQSDRGLQIESVPATWLMMKRVVDPNSGLEISFSPFNAYEIFGPQVATWMQISDVLMGLAIGLAASLLLIRVLRGGHGDADQGLTTMAIVFSVIAIVAWIIMANKTFSPQYMIWLAGPLAVAISLPVSRALRIWTMLIAALGLAAAWLTHQVYPTYYGGLISLNPMTTTAITCLLWRNLLVTAIAVESTLTAVWLTWRTGSPRSASVDSPSE